MIVVGGQVVRRLSEVNHVALDDRVDRGRGALKRHRCWSGGMTELTERCESLAELAESFANCRNRKGCGCDR